MVRRREAPEDAEGAVGTGYSLASTCSFSMWPLFTADCMAADPATDFIAGVSAHVLVIGTVQPRKGWLSGRSLVRGRSGMRIKSDSLVPRTLVNGDLAP